MDGMSSQINSLLREGENTAKDNINNMSADNAGLPKSLDRDFMGIKLYHQNLFSYLYGFYLEIIS